MKGVLYKRLPNGTRSSHIRSFPSTGTNEKPRGACRLRRLRALHHSEDRAQGVTQDALPTLGDGIAVMAVPNESRKVDLVK